jgi:glycerophosphoryl diester phosphodiesterase
MSYFEIVAHRGAPTDKSPENTMPAFQRAIELGADAIELDVRLTADHVPAVYHYFYLEEVAGISGPIFNYTFHQLQNLNVFGDNICKISSLPEVLETIGGKIGLEIEIKGPEPESVEIVSGVLHQFKHLWEIIEVTSYEPILLVNIQQRCPGLVTDLLFPRSENWMRLDVVTHLALHRARLANARAVHLHPTQLTAETVSTIRQQGIEVHAWDVNDEQSLNMITELNIPRICTDKLPQALDFRQRVEAEKD